MMSGDEASSRRRAVLQAAWVSSFVASKAETTNQLMAKLTPEEAAQRWRRGVTALRQLGYSGQDTESMLLENTRRGTKCGNCGAPYRPDPRRVWQCAYCGAQDWR